MTRYSVMDNTEVSEASNSGSIPGGGANTMPNQLQANGRAKRHFTIGVTSSEKLTKTIEEHADSISKTFASTSRELATAGFEKFEKRIWTESSEAILNEFKNDLQELTEGDSSQWMLRLDIHTAVKLRSTAKEFDESASKFAAMCIAHELKLAHAINA